MKHRNSPIERVLMISTILALCIVLVVGVMYAAMRITVDRTSITDSIATADESSTTSTDDYAEKLSSYTKMNEELLDFDHLFTTDLDDVNDTIIEFCRDVEEVVVEDSKPDVITYHVQYGDSFWYLADQFYNDGTMYEKIMTDNGITSLYPGDVINIYDPVNSHIEDEVAMQRSITEPAEPVVYNEPAPVSGSSDGTKPDASTYKDSTLLDTSGMEYVGNWRITGYDPHCSHCCGKTNGITASGNQAVLGYSCGSNSLPLGTQIYIEGYGIFRVDDRGGSSQNLIDIACDSHDICYTMTGNADVYIVG